MQTNPTVKTVISKIIGRRILAIAKPYLYLGDRSAIWQAIKQTEHASEYSRLHEKYYNLVF